jgi:hypothetical protein
MKMRRDSDAFASIEKTGINALLHRKTRAMVKNQALLLQESSSKNALQKLVGAANRLRLRCH